MAEKIDRPVAANSFLKNAEERKKRKAALAELTLPEPEETPVPEVESSSAKVYEKKVNPSMLTRKTYYVTEQLHNSLRMLSITEKKDVSELVRSAIEEYLGKYN